MRSGTSRRSRASRICPPAEANLLAGKDPDYSQRDLFHSIETGNFPKWRVAIQVMPEAEAATCKLNPFDLTKVWSQKDYPLIDVGELVLDEMVEEDSEALVAAGDRKPEK
jgi:catalase